MHLVGVASEVANKRDGDHDVAEADVLAQDAQRRNIVWDADVKADNPVSTQDGLLGQRMPDGSIAPMGKCITGRAEKQAAHVDQLVYFFANALSHYLHFFRTFLVLVTWRRLNPMTATRSLRLALSLVLLQ